MTKDGRVVLPGSESRRWLRETPLETTPEPEGRTRITLLLRRRAPLPDRLVQTAAVVTNEQLSKQFGADPADVALVSEIVQRAGLQVVEADAEARLVTVEGTLAGLTSVFGTELELFEGEDPFRPDPVRYRRRIGEMTLPAELDGIVLSVIGLGTQPIARPEFHVPDSTPQITYSPVELGRLYRFPPELDGTGRRLAVISLGGACRPQDLDDYFAALGLSTPDITHISIDGAPTAPGDGPATRFDLEVTLDLQIAGALAPGATILNYVTHNNGQGILLALRAAIHASPSPTVISLSWGSPEITYSGQLALAMHDLFEDAAALGITVCAASGDSGSSSGMPDGGSHVNYPASDPCVLACGGTSLIADPATGTIHSETTWNTGASSATGGGVSGVFDLPPWQGTADVPPRPDAQEHGRGVPDVAANADNQTGYRILLGGNEICVGGTSAATPLWAALVCRAAQSLDRPLGLLQPLIYQDLKADTVTPGFRDVVLGDNGTYAARPGWDPNTGLGSPHGEELLAVLRQRFS
ncbi:S53 family peptidase [Kineosporia sp. NBRC 101731]|uniref:S53 family peptidase n=1 Tax=Kineosporia sp. NBRC 101731 TaxID=3032199 RepID=UPI0024A447BA|nr:S53 family peptidase [Kineosporia sp. NBRC 101731]GLY32615.1 kumamolisin [Kineosporia sp. NBRC 101731]